MVLLRGIIIPLATLNKRCCCCFCCSCCCCYYCDVLLLIRLTHLSVDRIVNNLCQQPLWLLPVLWFFCSFYVQTIDMTYFLLIMVVFLMAYGVAQQAILFPLEQGSWSLIPKVFFRPYFQVYGELFIEDTTNSGKLFLLFSPPTRGRGYSLIRTI